MKKYLNKSLFYQGDAKIILPLLIVYIGVLLLNKLSFSNYFDWQIRQRLYGGYQESFIFSIESVVILVLYLIFTVSPTFKFISSSTILRNLSSQDVRLNNINKNIKLIFLIKYINPFANDYIIN